MYVYFIAAFGEKKLRRIKIGYSNDPAERVRRLQTGSPVQLKLLGVVKCRSETHAKSVERLAHNIFYKQRRRGEWFRLSNKHVEQIRSLIAKCAALDVPEMPEVTSDEGKRLDAEYRAIMGAP